MTNNSITLASRDSLLALAQTIDAALRLENAGFVVKILTMKTAGDLHLNAPLYEVAQKNAPKEGRAFFTKELDEALLAGRADAAVHSFKDLPTEKVAGITEPIFFGEVTGKDVLLLRDTTPLTSGGARLTIGTSSLRRIHQLQLVLPQAKIVTLRGNVITRLHKLLSADRGMNAILVAAAGIKRLTDFSRLPEQRYAHFFAPEILAHIRSELMRFNSVKAALEQAIELPEECFPTAPGQGVLALQLATNAAAKYGKDVIAVFSEHAAIAARVQHERNIMAGLMTGCHAPLGVSVLNDTTTGEKILCACYSRKAATEPLSFSDSVWLERRITNDTTFLLYELRSGIRDIVWWGLKIPPEENTLTIRFVQAIRQVALPVAAANDVAPPEALFVASPKAADYVAEHREFVQLPLYTAGAETASHLAKCIKDAKIISTVGKGFSSVLAALPNKNMHLLWVGSTEGEKRARDCARDFPNVRFLSVYANEPVVPQNLSSSPETLHVLTSAVAAEAFVLWARQKNAAVPAACCFGDSAAQVLRRHGINPYHLSKAKNFSELIREIKGDPTLIGERWQTEIYGTQKIG